MFTHKHVSSKHCIHHASVYCPACLVCHRVNSTDNEGSKNSSIWKTMFWSYYCVFTGTRKLCHIYFPVLVYVWLSCRCWMIYTCELILISQGYNSPREFLVTQGPLHSTRDDFWRMCWESNSRAIVMLTRCIEKGREKCDHYWPYDTMPVYYGDISVQILNDSHYQDWSITEFMMCRVSDVVCFESTS